MRHALFNRRALHRETGAVVRLRHYIRRHTRDTCSARIEGTRDAINTTVRADIYVCMCVPRNGTIVVLFNLKIREEFSLLIADFELNDSPSKL